MTDEQVIGMNYFDHQFLRKEDFETAQDYHINRLREHNRLLHRSGIVDGLEVSRTGDSSVAVAMGRAVDKEHREVVLRQTADPEVPPLLRVQTATGFQETEAHITATAMTLSIDLSSIPATNAPVFITIQGGMKETTPSEDPGITGNTRLVERAVIEASTIPPSGAQLLLATLKRNPDGTLARDPDLTEEYATAQLADDAVTSAKIAEADGTTGQNTNTGEGIKTGHIQNGAITGPKLASNAVSSTKIAANAVTSAKIAEADGTTSQHTNIGRGVKTGHIQDGAVTEDKLDPDLRSIIESGGVGDDAILSAMIAEADGTTGQDTSTGTGIKEGHLQDDAVTEDKLHPSARGKLVTNGDNHDHSGGDGATIKHSSLDLDDTNPHGVTAAQVGALPIMGGSVSGNLSIGGKISAGGSGNAVATFMQETAGTDIHAGLIAGYGFGAINFGLRSALVGCSTSSEAYGVYAQAPSGTYALFVAGAAVFLGAKTGYVVDAFVNASGQTLRTGDVVKLKGTPITRFRGDDNKIPVVEVTLADKENAPAVIGIVDREAIPDPEEPDPRTTPEDPTSIPDGGELFVVTMGTYAHCRVDAAEAPIEVGDLLTTSSNPGHAKKATDPKIGTIIGKALESLAEGTGYIAVFVNIQ